MKGVHCYSAISGWRMKLLNGFHETFHLLGRRGGFLSFLIEERIPYCGDFSPQEISKGVQKHGMQCCFQIMPCCNLKKQKNKKQKKQKKNPPPTHPNTKSHCQCVCFCLTVEHAKAVQRSILIDNLPATVQDDDLQRAFPEALVSIPLDSDLSRKG